MTNGYFGKVDPTSYLDNPPSDFESPHTLISWNVSLKKENPLHWDINIKHR